MPCWYFYHEKSVINLLILIFSITFPNLSQFIVRQFALLGDPGIVRAEGPLREVLRGVGEGIVKGYCSECQLASPPLAHHCRLCVACHHQTDHHCLFLNTCIAANNHWYFVVFIMTNIILMTGFLSAAYTATVPPGVQGDWVERLTSQVHNLLNEDMWTVLMAVCNEASLIWAFYLLKWVLQNHVLCSHITERIRVNMIKERCLAEWQVL